MAEINEFYCNVIAFKYRVDLLEVKQDLNI